MTRRWPWRTAVLAVMVACGSAAVAQASQPGSPQAPGCGPRVLVEYTDDDPDYFIIKNRSPAGWSLSRLAIDLSNAATSLVFDPEDGGPGVGGASPFRVYEDSPVRLVGSVPATDGGRTIGLVFENFAPGANFTFHIDLDAIADTGERTWVLPGDMAGARLTAAFSGPAGQNDSVEASFDDRAEADSGAGGCV